MPALYERYQNATPQAVDEYTLSQALGSDLQAVMEDHYKTFIVCHPELTSASALRGSGARGEGTEEADW